jgi:hypothetical protein
LQPSAQNQSLLTKNLNKKVLAAVILILVVVWVIPTLIAAFDRELFLWFVTHGKTVKLAPSASPLTHNIPSTFPYGKKSMTARLQNLNKPLLFQAATNTLLKPTWSPENMKSTLHLIPRMNVAVTMASIRELLADTFASGKMDSQRQKSNLLFII